jgi:hypothetical protein
MSRWRVEVHFEADDDVLHRVSMEAALAMLTTNAWPGADADIDRVAGEAAVRSMPLEQRLQDLVTRRLYWSLTAPTASLIRLVDPGVRALRVTPE